MIQQQYPYFFSNLPREVLSSSAEELSLNSTVRESMAHLPSSLQPLLTWITGKAAKGQKRSTHTPLYHLGTALVSLIAGWALIYFGGIFLTLIGMLLVTGSMRKLQIVIVHHCSHSNFFGRKSKGNGILGNIISFTLFIEPFRSYKKSHSLDHHFGKHMTKEDPTVSFLFNRVGLKAQMTVEEAKARLLYSLFCPAFYLEGFWQRLNEQKKMDTAGKLGLILFWAMLFFGAFFINALPFLFLGWIVPLFVLYPISSALRLAVEHTFPQTQENRKFDLESLSDFCNAVYCGEAYPQTPNLLSVAGWWMRMLFIHLPIRVFVLVGDTPVHDHHHRHPVYKDWPNYAFARIEALEEERGKNEYREVWGYFNALNHSLRSLSLAHY